MTFRLPDERVPESEPWRDRDFLEWAIHEHGLAPRTIAYELGISNSRVTVHAERLGVLRP
jgi:FixJ family two-component response regulator